ncbi:MAG: hypothetical protein HQ523_15855 [Lentisphaerae bacterium]|nr:hypothetical protein [Lentisphaerota bacterium]
MTFFFTLVFMFLVYWRPQDWLVPQLYGVPILDAVTFIALLALLLEMGQGRIDFPKRMPQVFLLGGLWFAAMFSHVPHTYFAGIMATLPEVFKICFFSLLMLCVLDRPARLRSVARLLVAMSLFMAVHAILQADRGYGFGPVRPYYVPAYADNPEQYRTLFYGIFEDSNDMAQTLATSIPLSFVVLRRGKWLSLLVGGVCTAVLFLGIQTTYSDGGMIALFAVGGVMLVMALPARWVPTMLTIGILGGLALCPFSGAILDESAHDRVVFWGYANEAFKHNLFFGVGHAMFWQVADSRAAHNAFVECYTEIGLFGYWFWFSLLLLSIAGCWRVRRLLAKDHKDPERAWLFKFSGMALAAMIGMSASSYFLSRAFHFPTFFLFSLLGALPRVTQAYLPEGAEPIVRWDSRTVILLTVGAVGSVVYIYISILLLNRVWGG